MSKDLISFVLPAKEEEESLEPLVSEIIKECKKIKKTYEIIVIDDGSIDKTFEVVKRLHKKNKNISGIKLRRNFGKSTALFVGFLKAKGEIIFTMDSDLQDNPAEISKFLGKIKQGYDLVSGWKKKRKDPLTKTFPSKVFNFVVSKMTGIKIHDFNCGYKAYKRQVVKNMSLYGELYRFIPVLAKQKGYKIAEVVVKHRKRKYGKSKYGWLRIIRGFLDFITVLYLTSYYTRPGHFFGTLGIAFFIPGFLIGLYIAYLRITTGGIAFRYPLLFLGALLMIVGVQFISTGLLAEMILSSQIETPSSEIIEETT